MCYVTAQRTLCEECGNEISTELLNRKCSSVKQKRAPWGICGRPMDDGAVQPIPDCITGWCEDCWQEVRNMVDWYKTVFSLRMVDLLGPRKTMFRNLVSHYTRSLAKEKGWSTEDAVMHATEAMTNRVWALANKLMASVIENMGLAMRNGSGRERLMVLAETKMRDWTWEQLKLMCGEKASINALSFPVTEGGVQPGKKQKEDSRVVEPFEAGILRQAPVHRSQPEGSHRQASPQDGVVDRKGKGKATRQDEEPAAVAGESSRQADEGITMGRDDLKAVIDVGEPTVFPTGSRAPPPPPPRLPPPPPPPSPPPPSPPSPLSRPRAYSIRDEPAATATSPAHRSPLQFSEPMYIEILPSEADSGRSSVTLDHEEAPDSSPTDAGQLRRAPSLSGYALEVEVLQALGR